MIVLLAAVMGGMLLSASVCMEAASAACRLFVESVLPGLFPYMTLCLMLVSRVTQPPEWAVVLLGWCGGSPTGARLLGRHPSPDKRTAIRCATMSPMFLLGTLGAWLDSPAAGAIILISVAAGAYLTGCLAPRKTLAQQGHEAAAMSFGEAVTAAAQTMLLVCGTMVVLRVLTDLLTQAFPGAALPIALGLEVTTAARMLSQLPLPLSLRTALLSAATGMGGAASLMQNRALYPKGLLSLGEQALWQAVHGVISGLLALGMALLAGI